VLQPLEQNYAELLQASQREGGLSVQISTERPVGRIADLFKKTRSEPVEVHYLRIRYQDSAGRLQSAQLWLNQPEEIKVLQEALANARGAPAKNPEVIDLLRAQLERAHYFQLELNKKVAQLKEKTDVLIELGELDAAGLAEIKRDLSLLTAPRTRLQNKAANYTRPRIRDLKTELAQTQSRQNYTYQEAKVAQKEIEFLRLSNPQVYREFQEFLKNITSDGLAGLARQPGHYDLKRLVANGHYQARLNQKYRVEFSYDETSKTFVVLEVHGHSKKIWRSD
jgi:hypothetical protein